MESSTGFVPPWTWPTACATDVAPTLERSAENPASLTDPDPVNWILIAARGSTATTAAAIGHDATSHLAGATVSGIMSRRSVQVHAGAALGRYGFGAGHPFGANRLQAFLDAAAERGLLERALLRVAEPADIALLRRYHAASHIEWVRTRCASGEGWLDSGNTPAEPHLFDAARHVVGSTVAACRALMRGECRHAFNPIGGLHHARRVLVEGFCVFSDIGVAVESLRAEFGVRRIAYVDIDAHHGDGIYYDYEHDADLCVVDFHEDGRFLYPGSGAAGERGTGDAAGRKLNIPLPPDAGDEQIAAAWPEAERLLDDFRPEFVIYQCGADSLAGDPLTHLRLSDASHAMLARALCALAERHARAGLLALGGGGYDLGNIARAWCRVLECLLDDADAHPVTPAEVRESPAS